MTAPFRNQANSNRTPPVHSAASFRMPAQCAGTSGEASAEASIDDPTVKLGTNFAIERFPATGNIDAIYLVVQLPAN